jgi:uncharacterized membrane protein
MPDLVVAGTAVAALGCGLTAGVFFAFSSFVMKALERLSAPRGIAAMQSINLAVLTPSFMTLLFGTAAACAGLIAWAILDWHGSVGPWLLIGGGLYLAGPIGLTVAYHQPRNLALGAVDPRARDAGPAALCSAVDGAQPRPDAGVALRRGDTGGGGTRGLKRQYHPGDLPPKPLTNTPRGRRILKTGFVRSKRGGAT